MDSAEAIARYQTKKNLCHGVDPYTVTTKATDVPLTVTFAKIYQFLVVDPNPFTGVSKDCSKAMDAILYFRNGWVKNLAGGKVQNIHVVHGQVHHSFALNEKPLAPWVLIEEDGTIIAAHCTCAIGLLEACSHIGATLFALDGIRAAILDNKISVTDLPAYLKKPPTLITQDLYKPMSGVNLGRRISRKFLTPNLHRIMEPQCRDLLAKLKSKGLQVAAMSLFCGDPAINFKCSSCDENTHIEQSLNMFNLRPLYDETLRGKTLNDVRKLAGAIFEQLPRDRETIQLIEKHTRDQKKSKWWMILRVGRITASILKDVCCTSPTKPSIALIKKVCYPEQTSFSTPSVRYGEKHEKEAVEQLYAAIKEIHSNLVWQPSGLIISEEGPHLAASPDAIFKCDCHGQITVEVKCPYSARQDEYIINTLLNLKDPFISKDLNGFITLNSAHKYYLQALMQVHVANANFGYFYVWSSKESLIFEVKRNEQYWNYYRTKATIFHQTVIIPELLAKSFTKQD